MMHDLSNDDIEQLLQTQHYGHLGCYADDEVYVVPTTYAYKDNVIYSYTHDGKKIQKMRLNPQVCFQVEDISAPDDWQSAICWGRFEEVWDHEARQNGAMLLAERFSEARDNGTDIYSPLIKELSDPNKKEGSFPILYTITLTEKTGKRQKEA